MEFWPWSHRIHRRVYFSFIVEVVASKQCATKQTLDGLSLVGEKPYASNLLSQERFLSAPVVVLWYYVLSMAESAVCVFSVLACLSFVGGLLSRLKQGAVEV